LSSHLALKYIWVENTSTWTDSTLIVITRYFYKCVHSIGKPMHHYPFTGSGVVLQHHYFKWWFLTGCVREWIAPQDSAPSQGSEWEVCLSFVEAEGRTNRKSQPCPAWECCVNLTTSSREWEIWHTQKYRHKTEKWDTWGPTWARVFIL
jgi:hypothetical protein